MDETVEYLIGEIQRQGMKEFLWLDRIGFQNAIFSFLVQKRENLSEDKSVFLIGAF